MGSKMKKHLNISILRDGGFDENQYEILVDNLGTDYSDETPLTLSKILELTSISPCLWAFQYFDECHHEVLKKIAVELAIYCAADVLPIFEKEYPNNEIPRKAIAAARAWLDDPNDETAKAAAHAAAADDAADADAAEEAADAACAACYAACAAYAADAADAACAADAANSFSCTAYASCVSKSKYALHLKTLLEKHGF